MTPERLAEWREDAVKRSHAADAHLVFARRVVTLADALEDMTREARLSREATEKAVARVKGMDSEGWAAYAAEQERHSELRELARRVVMDYGDACDHPDDCDCSMAQLTRTVEQ